MSTCVGAPRAPPGTAAAATAADTSAAAGSVDPGAGAADRLDAGGPGARLGAALPLPRSRAPPTTDAVHTKQTEIKVVAMDLNTSGRQVVEGCAQLERRHNKSSKDWSKEQQ